jgi:hypothetical protein
VKTTAGKTRTRRPARAIAIFNLPERKNVAVRRASSLRQALLEYHKDVLKPKGFVAGIVVGNVLTVNHKDNLNETWQFYARDL